MSRGSWFYATGTSRRLQVDAATGPSNESWRGGDQHHHCSGAKTAPGEVRTLASHSQERLALDHHPLTHSPAHLVTIRSRVCLTNSISPSPPPAKPTPRASL